MKQKVGDIVCQRPAKKKLHRQVIDALGILAFVCFLSQYPPLREHVAYRTCHCFVTLPGDDCTRSFYVVEEQMPFVQPIGSHELNWAKPVLFVLRNSDRGCHGDLRTHKGLPFLELTAPPRPIPLPRDIHEVVCAVTSGSMST